MGDSQNKSDNICKYVNLTTVKKFIEAYIQNMDEELLGVTSMQEKLKSSSV